MWPLRYCVPKRLEAAGWEIFWMRMSAKVVCGFVLGCGAMGFAAKAMAQASDLDKMFLMRASESNLAEIQQSELAVNKSSNPKVRAFAQKMISDHEMLEDNLKIFFEQDSVTPAATLNADHQAEYAKLKGLKGADFDNEYIRSMDMDHHMALAAFDTVIQNTEDSELKRVAVSGRKVVEEHTKMVDKMLAKIGQPIGSL